MTQFLLPLYRKQILINEKEAYVKDYLEKSFRKDPNIVARKIADQVILVPIRQNVGDLESIYTLNEVAARIWGLIDGKMKIKEIRDKIVEGFEVSSEEAEKDIIDFLKKLEAVGGISAVGK